MTGREGIGPAAPASGAGQSDERSIVNLRGSRRQGQGTCGRGPGGRPPTPDQAHGPVAMKEGRRFAEGCIRTVASSSLAIQPPGL